MSSLEATLSMLEVMPEEARRKVFEYTQQLFMARKPANPFVPMTADQILSDLEQSRRQIAQGQGADMEIALSEMGKALHQLGSYIDYVRNTFSTGIDEP